MSARASTAPAMPPAAFGCQVASAAGTIRWCTMTDPTTGAMVSAGTVTARGILHLPDGTRRFLPGHTASVSHGAYAVIHLGPRVEALADELRPSVPAYAASDEVALRLLALALSRLEATSAALANAGPEAMQRLRSDERSWANSARNTLADLGMTPASRARLGLDLHRSASLAGEIEAALDARARADARMSVTVEDEDGTP